MCRCLSYKLSNASDIQREKVYVTRPVTKWVLIPPPALQQKLVFCTQTDTDRWTDRQADSRIP